MEKKSRAGNKSGEEFHYLYPRTGLAVRSKAMKGYTTQNTDKSNKWAVSNFTQWYTERNKSNPGCRETSTPLEILLTNDAKKLCGILSAFVKETRKGNGEEYTPKSLYLIPGLQREICTCVGL